MDAAEIVKSTQAQAVAAWVDYLNQQRLTELIRQLGEQDINLSHSLEILAATKNVIGDIVTSNRGGGKGMHGFIAEAAECGIGNARNIVQGARPEYIWVNDNGPVDLIRNGISIQQKFVQAQGHFSLNAVAEHLNTYPQFLQNGGKYQIPKDFYDKLMTLMSMSEDEAKRLVASGSSERNPFTYSNWKWVHEFFETNGLTTNDIEPSLLDYSDVQRNAINQTIERETQSIKETDQELRNEAFQANRATFREGVQVAAVGAVMEGGMNFCLTVTQKLKEGKHLHDFTAEDWQEAGIEIANGGLVGAVRGGSIYAMTNFSATPAPVANALVTAALGISSLANQLRKGAISEEDFLIESETVCLDVSVSAIASILGQIAIPVPVLGTIVGNIVGMFMYGLSKELLDKREQRLIEGYSAQMAELNARLSKEHMELLARLLEEFERFTSALELAFDPDINVAFAGSIELALHVGVPSEDVLKSKAEIDNFFEI